LDAEIIAVGVEDKITKIREYIPIKSQKITLSGIYDGDQRAGLPALENTCPAVFLPGSEPMEASLKRMAFIDPARAANFLQITEGEFSIANDLNRGNDPRDWLYDLAKSLGMTFEFTLRGLLEAWIEDSNNKAAVGRFIEEMREKLSEFP
jgi:hypothetical protein